MGMSFALYTPVIRQQKKQICPEQLEHPAEGRRTHLMDSSGLIINSRTVSLTNRSPLSSK